MASTTVNGKDGTADWSQATTSYKALLDMIRIREVIEMTNADTFALEGTADQEPGRSQLVFEIGGIAKKGLVTGGPMIPAPQNVAIVVTFTSGNTITFTANFTEATADRLVNQNMRLAARGLSKGAYVVVWT
jgi:hypothetical protein